MVLILLQLCLILKRHNMKKFLKKLNKSKRYEVVFEFQTANWLLYDLWIFLSSWGKYDPNEINTCNGLSAESLNLDKTSDEKNVYLWDSNCIKQQAEMPGLSKAEQYAFDNAYEAYLEKAWADMSQLIMTMENYIDIVQKWQKIVLDLQPAYIIISQNDAGYVDLIGKDELSEQDLHDMKIEHEKYLKYEKARQAYQKDHPDHSEVWRGPQDNEFEEDIMKYYKD